MANEEHLRILKQGVAVWSQWRAENRNLYLDLSYADLRYADLNHVYLSETDLRYTDLSQANLAEAYLRGAELGHATLSHADLRGANFTGATLDDVDLRGAKLAGAYLSGADLTEACLNKAHLKGTYFERTDLSGADLTNVTVGYTKFLDVDLGRVKGLETVKHEAPSSIDISTIYRSKGNIPYKFLLDAGVPKDDIHYLLSLAGKAIDFYSCFISYSSKDQAFAKRLHADLQAQGVRCWYAPEDLKIGEPILAGIDRGIRLHDKLLLVLSEHSIKSNWVEHEVEAALVDELQPHRKAKVLFPIRLDNAALETNVDWANRIRQTRHIGDFTNWKAHDAYQVAFERLLRDLKAES